MLNEKRVVLDWKLRRSVLGKNNVDSLSVLKSPREA